ncbi:MAG: hypothetical protein ACYTFY_23365 [Planctomycetota bacterium]
MPLLIPTLDTNGWDAVRSVIYQIRKDAPDGEVIKEGMLAEYESGWTPFGPDYPLRKVYGMPMVFGVPKGAKKDGKLLANQNVFAVKMYRAASAEGEDMGFAGCSSA